ncbi:MAG TPA: hypothetical protein VLG67_01595 [Candidatus Saccharimonadales bacterium]|nr:hypothetical protein [Candidatus Saccharimonadales bacterium]
MEKVHHLFILPGLGKHEAILELIRRNWEKEFDIQIHILAIDWHDNTKDFKQKIISLTNQIKPYSTNKNSTISLLGISAGASAAINVWKNMNLEVESIILVCGRVKEGKARGARTLHWASRNSPSFKESVLESERNLKKLSPNDNTKILIFYSLLDELVPPNDARINGAKNLYLIVPEHVLSIVFSMIFYKKIITEHILTLKRES